MDTPGFREFETAERALGYTGVLEHRARPGLATDRHRVVARDAQRLQSRR